MITYWYNWDYFCYIEAHLFTVCRNMPKLAVFINMSENEAFWATVAGTWKWTEWIHGYLKLDQWLNIPIIWCDIMRHFSCWKYILWPYLLITHWDAINRIWETYFILLRISANNYFIAKKYKYQYIIKKKNKTKTKTC